MRCDECGYEFTGNEKACPECGCPVNHEEKKDEVKTKVIAKDEKILCELENDIHRINTLKTIFLVIAIIFSAIGTLTLPFFVGFAIIPFSIPYWILFIVYTQLKQRKVIMTNKRLIIKLKAFAVTKHFNIPLNQINTINFIKRNINENAFVHTIGMRINLPCTRNTEEFVNNAMSIIAKYNNN